MNNIFKISFSLTASKRQTKPLSILTGTNKTDGIFYKFTIHLYKFFGDYLGS
jgi:hypothetical protein